LVLKTINKKFHCKITITAANYENYKIFVSTAEIFFKLKVFEKIEPNKLNKG